MDLEENTESLQIMRDTAALRITDEYIYIYIYVCVYEGFLPVSSQGLPSVHIWALISYLQRIQIVLD